MGSAHTWGTQRHPPIGVAALNGRQGPVNHKVQGSNPPEPKNSNCASPSEPGHDIAVALVRGMYWAMNPPTSHADLLTRPLYAHFATVRPDGAPLVNPMWFLWDEARGVVKLTHTKLRHNYNFIRRDPRVALAISDPDDQFRYLQIRGVVVAIDDDPSGTFHAELQLRYNVTREVSEREARVIVTVRPTGFKVR